MPDTAGGQVGLGDGAGKRAGCLPDSTRRGRGVARLRARGRAGPPRPRRRPEIVSVRAPLFAGAGLEPLGERLPENPPERLVPDVRRLAVDAPAAAHHRAAAPAASHVKAVRPAAHRARAYVLAAPVAEIEPGRPILDVGRGLARGHDPLRRTGAPHERQQCQGLRDWPTGAKLPGAASRGICFGARSCPRRAGRAFPNTTHPAAARRSAATRRAPGP